MKMAGIAPLSPLILQYIIPEHLYLSLFHLWTVGMDSKLAALF